MPAQADHQPDDVDADKRAFVPRPDDAPHAVGLAGRGTLGTVSCERVPPSTQITPLPMLGAGPRRSASLALPDETTAVRSFVDWTQAPPQGSAMRFRLELTEERVPLDQGDGLVELACSRLPPALRKIDAADWARRLPGEDYRVICGEK